MKLTLALRDELLARAAELLAEHCRDDPVPAIAALHQLGHCALAATVAERAARAMGVRCRRRHGRAIAPDGTLVSNHSWGRVGRRSDDHALATPRHVGGRRS
jgi:hypothetical protein